MGTVIFSSKWLKQYEEGGNDEGCERLNPASAHNKHPLPARSGSFYQLRCGGRGMGSHGGGFPRGRSGLCERSGPQFRFESLGKRQQNGFLPGRGGQLNVAEGKGWSSENVEGTGVTQHQQLLCAQSGHVLL